MVVAVIWLGLAGFLVGDACEFIGHGGGVVVVVGHEYFEAVGAVMEDEAGAMQGAGFTFLGREDADGCDGGHIDPVAVWEFGEFHACSGLAGWFGGLGVFELGGEASDQGTASSSSNTPSSAARADAPPPPAPSSAAESPQASQHAPSQASHQKPSSQHRVDHA